MERRLKERLVGASILVVLIVLVVPELLSGPKQAMTTVAPLSMPTLTTRTVTVDLDTKKTMSLETPSEMSVTASAVQPLEPAAPAEQPAAAPEEVTPPASAPMQHPPATHGALVHAPNALSAPTAHSAPTDNQAASAKTWAVQLGSFASHANAEQLMRSVKAHDSPAYVSPSGAGKSLRYRVRVGPLADRTAAERMLTKLKGEGHVASLIAP